ncbi:unnamed protein product [Rhodiola kirilowii]
MGWAFSSFDSVDKAKKGYWWLPVPCSDGLQQGIQVLHGSGALES